MTDTPLQERLGAPMAEGPPGSASQRLTQKRQRTLDRLGEQEGQINAAPLLAVLDCSPHDPDKVAQAVKRCPLLAARLLSVTNSVAFRGRRPIESVSRAVIHLGASRARAIALAYGLRAMTEGTGLPPDLTKQLWLASLNKAAAAKLACDVIEPRLSESVFSLAMIQDIGLPLLVGLDPDFYQTQLVPGGQRGSWSRQEVEHFGIDHAGVAYDILTRWHASERLANTVLHHHRVPTDFTGKEMMAQVPLYLASLMPHLHEELTGTERDWLNLLHAQFLSRRYASPHAFFEAAFAYAAGCHQSAGTAVNRDQLLCQLVRATTSDTVTMVSQLCRLESALGRQRESLDTLRSQAFTDALTKVLNRRGFAQLAERRLEDAAHNRLSVCCMILDLDHFKQANDQHGHEAGDLILRGLAKLLRRNLDRSDLIGRLGGDEFAILLTGTDEARARAIATRLSNRCSGARIRSHDHELTVRFSLGAVYTPQLQRQYGLESLLHAADEAMYRQKRSGGAGVAFELFDVTEEEVV